MNKMIFGVAVAALLAGCATVSEKGCATLIAHRGESYDAPENTLPAYQTAVDRGFGFECDIYLSSDGRVFTFHDTDLKRTTGGVCTQKCWQASWADTVSKVDVGNWGKWKDSKFKGTRPALLEEVLALARPGRKIYVELKAGPDIVPYVKDIFAKEPKATPETVLFISFNADSCAALKRLMPEYKVYWLTSIRPWKGDAPALTADEVIARLRACKADGVDACFRQDVVTAEFVAAVKKAGFEFHMWTIDDPAVAEEAFRRGADTVTTNRAKYILETLRKKGVAL